MAIRQVDERFLVGTILPALEQAEELVEQMDMIEDLRNQRRGEDQIDSALSVKLTKTLDDLCLKVKYEGTLGGWKAIEARLPGIQQRCPHTNRTKRTYWVKNEEDKRVISRPTASCSRCHLALEDILPPAVEPEAQAS